MNNKEETLKTFVWISFKNSASVLISDLIMFETGARLFSFLHNEAKRILVQYKGPLGSMIMLLCLVFDFFHRSFVTYRGGGKCWSFFKHPFISSDRKYIPSLSFYSKQLLANIGDLFILSYHEPC